VLSARGGLTALSCTAASGLLAVSCSIAVDQTAREVPDPPSELTVSITATTLPEEAEPGNTVDLYFLNEGNQLVVVERDWDTPATPQDALNALLTAPTEQEIDELDLGALRSTLIGQNYTAQPGPDASGVLVVTVGSEVRSTGVLEPGRVLLIYQQIVCTLTAMDLGIASVLIQDGEGIIPAAISPEPVEGPVGRAQLGDCTAVPPTTTTTRPTPSTRRLNTTAAPTTTVLAASAPPST
jgi:hypothetical protein